MKIDEFIRVNPELALTKFDFENLLYCYNLLIAAKGSINNICAVQYYLKEIEKDITVLPEEIKGIQADLEKHIDELESYCSNWQSEAFDRPQTKWLKGARFVSWKVKTKRAKNEFKAFFDGKMKWIKMRLTPDSPEAQKEFASMIKALDNAIP